jgi:AcrR family transcriptional regulator
MRSTASSSVVAPETASPTTPATASDEARRVRLLEGALATFARFGYRKTSMEEVARAAGISRQGLYLHFPTKDDLFRATVHFALKEAITAANARLLDTTQSIDARLVGAFDEWIGRYVGLFGGDVSDIMEASTQLLGSALADHDTAFLESVTKVVRGSGLPAAYKSAGLNARQLAETLHATAKGLKHTCRTREEFVERIQVAVRALCMPLA